MSQDTFNELVFVKLGGAAITDKSGTEKINKKVLDAVSKEIAEVHKNFRILIGHGSGSFGHPIAAKYKVQEGLGKCGIEGFVQTQKAARSLNSIVVDSLVNAGVPAVSIQTSACTICSNGKIEKMFTSPIEGLYNSGIVPVIYGDVICDTAKGCSIASTEMIFRHLAENLKPARIIIGTDVDGVFTQDPKKGKGELIKEINKDNIDEILEMISESSVQDVTGGMAHKIKELYNLSKLGIKIEIINLLKSNYLTRAVSGENLGTAISYQ